MSCELYLRNNKKNCITQQPKSFKGVELQLYIAMCAGHLFSEFLNLSARFCFFFSIIFIGTCYTIKGCTAWTSQGKKAVILFLSPWAGQQGKPVGSFLHSRNSPGHPNPQITATAYLTFYGPGRQASEGLVALLSAAPGPRGDSSPAEPPA